MAHGPNPTIVLFSEVGIYGNPAILVPPCIVSGCFHAKMSEVGASRGR